MACPIAPQRTQVLRNCGAIPALRIAPVPVAGLLLSLMLLLQPVPRAQALLRIDFDQAYYTHPHTQVWDFCVIRPDSIYHIFYHGIPETNPHASHADTIWHATSPDLRHWDAPEAVLTVSGESWEAAAIWAPDVVRDEANQRWAMAYTACDAQMNQRMALATSTDLSNWTRVPQNPVIEPDSTQYIWSPSQWWSNFRDPFLYRDGEQWHILATASKRLTTNTGVLYHGISDDLENWTDAGILFANDGDVPDHVLESSQYLVRGSTHHLLFGEYDTPGISLVSAASPEEWTMSDRVIIDSGYAPEVKQFDPGVDIFGRIAPYQNPQTDLLSYVVRFDTLRVSPDGADLYVDQPHPLARDWASWSGVANLANPTFGDNPAFRGDTPAGTIGNGYYGSAEYFQGPLSGLGVAGTYVGDVALGTMTSYPFVITGDLMQLYVGGGNYPETCYVELVRSADQTVLYRETGANHETMTRREWNLRPFQGEVAVIRIVDAETGSFGHINVDEISEEWGDPAPSGLPAQRGPLQRCSAYPNPFNPRTEVRFELSAPAEVRLRVLDVAGREVWRSAARRVEAGPGRIRWLGQDAAGRSLAAGAYLYALAVDGRIAASGKLTLLK